MHRISEQERNNIMEYCTRLVTIKFTDGSSIPPVYVLLDKNERKTKQEIAKFIRTQLTYNGEMEIQGVMLTSDKEK